jgi:predicted nucleotidyltransferase component of viral defense system
LIDRKLPPGHWQALFPRALKLIAEISTHGGIADPFWTLGGGTVLMFRYRHRVSKDIDIFVPDPQYLGYVTPRLSDVAAEMTDDYTEMASSFVKLQFDEGEVDFVAAPNLLPNAWEDWIIEGSPVKVETAAEIIAKKMYHRGDRVTARDLFDLSLVIERETVRWSRLMRDRSP